MKFTGRARNGASSKRCADDVADEPSEESRGHEALARQASGLPVVAKTEQSAPASEASDSVKVIANGPE